MLFILSIFFLVLKILSFILFLLSYNGPAFKIVLIMILIEILYLLTTIGLAKFLKLSELRKDRHNYISRYQIASISDHIWNIGYIIYYICIFIGLILWLRFNNSNHTLNLRDQEIKIKEFLNSNSILNIILSIIIIILLLITYLIIIRYFDVKTSLRPIAESLPLTKGNLAVCSEFSYPKYNKRYPGEIGYTLPQLKNVDQTQFNVINDWKIALSTHLIKNKKQSPEECFYQMRAINDSSLLDPHIKVMIPSYFNLPPVDNEFSLLVENPELIFKIQNFAHPKNVNIDLLIPEAQMVDVAAMDAYYLSIAKLFKDPLMQEMVYNYFQVKTLTCI